MYLIKPPAERQLHDIEFRQVCGGAEWTAHAAGKLIAEIRADLEVVYHSQSNHWLLGGTHHYWAKSLAAAKERVRKSYRTIL